MRIEITTHNLYLYISLHRWSFYGELGVNAPERRVTLRLSTWSMLYLWRAWRKRAYCTECGKPEWHWWRHSDCIPF